MAQNFNFEVPGLDVRYLLSSSFNYFATKNICKDYPVKGNYNENIIISYDDELYLRINIVGEYW